MAEHLEMTTGSVLDILIYVFDRYMLVEAPAVPRREHLARDLERAGFAPAKVEREFSPTASSCDSPRSVVGCC